MSYQWGPLSVPLPLAAFLAALVLTYGVKALLRHKGFKGETAFWSDYLWEALPGALLFWKLSVLAEIPGQIIKDPLLLIYRPGSPAALVMALVLALLWLILRFYRTYVRKKPDRFRPALGVNALLFASLGLFFAAAWLLLPRDSGTPQSFPREAFLQQLERSSLLASGQGSQDSSAEPLTPETLTDEKPVLVINYWTSWCPSCRAEMPLFQDFYNRHSGEILLISINGLFQEGSPQDPLDLIEDYGLSFPVYADPQGKLAEFLGVQAFPETWIIGAGGEVLFHKRGVVTSLKKAFP